MEQPQNPAPQTPEEKTHRTARAKQFMKYAFMLWIVALALVTVYRFTEKHSAVNVLALPAAVAVLIAGTSFAMGALFLRLPNNK